MESNYSNSSLIISCFLWFVVLHSIPECLAARKLLDIFPNGTVPMPTPAPVINVTYRSDTRNGSHAQIVCVNGEPRSEGGTIRDENGNPIIQANSHTGYENGRVKGKNGKSEVHSTSSNGQSGSVTGSDGSHKIEVHKHANGAATVTTFDNDGKPISHLSYQIPADCN